MSGNAWTASINAGMLRSGEAVSLATNRKTVPVLAVMAALSVLGAYLIRNVLWAEVILPGDDLYGVVVLPGRVSRGEELREAVGEHGVEQSLLAAEVVVERRRLHAGAVADRARRHLAALRLVQPFGGRVQQAVASALGSGSGGRHAASV